MAAVAPIIMATATTIAWAYHGPIAPIAIAAIAAMPASSTDDDSSMAVAIAATIAPSTDDDSSMSVGTYMPSLAGPPR